MLADTSACNYLCCWNVVSTFGGILLVPFVPEVSLVILRASLEVVLIVVSTPVCTSPLVFWMLPVCIKASFTATLTAVGCIYCFFMLIAD